MMSFGRVINAFLASLRKIGLGRTKVSATPHELLEQTETSSIYDKPEILDELHSIWDFLEFTVNTQAFHLSKVIGFEEWVSMQEVRRRIKEVFGLDYKNEKSLYAYIKTMVDCGLFETSNIGGKRRWRKKDIIIRLKKKKPAEKERAEALQVS